MNKEVKEINDIIFYIEIAIENIEAKRNLSAKSNLIDLKNYFIDKLIERVE